MTKARVGLEEKFETDCARYTEGSLVLIVGPLSQICPARTRQKYLR